MDWICSRIPDPPRSPKGGRPPADKRRTVAGIFWILDHGAKWKDLPRRFGSKSTVHRWFQRWVKEGVFEKILRDAGRFVESRGEYRVYECFIDATFARAKGGGEGIGLTKVGKGVKIMILVDAKGLPVAVDTAPACQHESRAVQQMFDFMLPRQGPELIIGDKAFDSDALREELARMGVEMVAPHRRNRRPERRSQDGRRLRRYRRRWTVERTISWLQNFRRLCIRWERHANLFVGMLHFATAVLLVRSVLG